VIGLVIGRPPVLGPRPVGKAAEGIVAVERAAAISSITRRIRGRPRPGWRDLRKIQDGDGVLILTDMFGENADDMSSPTSSPERWRV